MRATTHTPGPPTCSVLSPFLDSLQPTTARPPRRSHLVSNSPAPKIDVVRRTLILIVAAIGFLFDTYELLMTPLVLAPALSELLQVPPNHPDVQAWVGRVLWITALCGGVFG